MSTFEQACRQKVEMISEQYMWNRRLRHSWHHIALQRTVESAGSLLRNGNVGTTFSHLKTLLHINKTSN